MIRFPFASSLALLLGALIVSGPASAQDPKPAAPAPGAEAARQAQEAAAANEVKAAQLREVMAKRAELKAAGEEVKRRYADEFAKLNAEIKEINRRSEALLRDGLTVNGRVNAAPSRRRVYNVVTRPVDTAAAISRWTSTVKTPVMRGASNFDALQANLGLELADPDDTLRAQLEIPGGEGVVVVGVKPGSLADKAGLKANDVVMSLGGQRTKGVDQARGILFAKGKDALEVDLIREGKPTRLSVAGNRNDAPPEAPEFWIGVPVSLVDPTLRSHLTGLPADVGLVVNDVVADSPAAKAGVKKGDILVKLGDKPLKEVELFRDQVKAAGDKPTPLEILRAGKPLTLTITAARRATTATTRLFRTAGGPGSTATFTFVQPDLGVENFGQITRRIDDLIKAQVAKPGEKPIDIQLELLTGKAKGDEANARIEAAVKDVKAQVEELKKLVESLKKPEAK